MSETVSGKRISVSPQYDQVYTNENEVQLVRGIQKQTSAQVSLFTINSNQKIVADLISRLSKNKAYIDELEAILKEHNIPLPDTTSRRLDDLKQNEKSEATPAVGIMKEGNEEEMLAVLAKVKALHRRFYVTIKFNNLGYYTMAPKQVIPTVGNEIKTLVCGAGPKYRVDILKGITGQIQPKRLTLLLGPPGSGKSSLLKALSGRLRKGNEIVDGEITYNNTKFEDGKYLIPKVADYCEQGDTHDATLTVEETLEYAWRSTSGGHHGYASAANAEAYAQFEQDDKLMSRVNNVILAIGLQGCRKTYIGDGTIRGISGGQKRRVTSAETMVCQRPVKLLDSISNGLDSATTYDIIRTSRDFCNLLGITVVISLLQPPPDVYNLFDDVILMSEGQIIFQGPRGEVLPYFDSLGYICPATVDVADFLQEIPTTEGIRYATSATIEAKDVPRGTHDLVARWKSSALFKKMVDDMNDDGSTVKDEEMGDNQTDEIKTWPEDFNKPHPGSFWYHFDLTFKRQITLTLRDDEFLKARIGQAVIVGAVAGSLFNNISPTSTASMSGFLFFSCLQQALNNFAMLPIVFGQKSVFYKHADMLFYPTMSYTLSQSVVLWPLQVIETVIFGTIMYWAAGLSDNDNGSRYFTYLLILITFAINSSQLFRLVAFVSPNIDAASPLAGICLVLMVLFSGFIQPKILISYGWEWFYWINPLAWALKSITVNQYASPDYDFQYCLGPSSCSKFGDVILKSFGNPTDQRWIWYGFAVLIAEYFLMFFLTFLAMKYMRVTPAPPLPIYVPDEESLALIEQVETNPQQTDEEFKDLPFDAVSFAFKDIWYTVTLPGGDELDLLKGVTGHFEPGTVTALMGSSGAGKTTLLDVLSGRKNTGVVKGEMFINGSPKEDHYFRRIMAYVEQFDSLSPHDTAREAIEFSAALRLSSDVTFEQREAWVNSVLLMLELKPLEKTMIGLLDQGGMSFEQRKRVSIGVELASNPSILFLDEPTTGLDSRAAQVVTRCIRRVAASGRSIVCTIHQPSIPIFNAFDSLLLLKRGGQIVFFGQLGDNSQYLVEYFSASPTAPRIKDRQNPASWMLEVIGAGTAATISTTDYHEFYKASELCAVNNIQTNSLCNRELTDEEKEKAAKSTVHHFNASYFMQFKHLSYKIFLSYWRTPSYNLTRFFINAVIGLIFASAYVNQNYDTQNGCISRAAVMFVTVLFCGVVGMQTVAPVTFVERPAFYREQQSEMYSVAIYSLVTCLVEIPYLILSSLCFVLPFFYIVGFHHQGDATARFFWYWLFQGLYTSVLVYLGQFLAAAMPSPPAADVAGGIAQTFISLFCGLMVKPQNIPSFWLFVYWLNPLHYAFQGLVVTQFHKDHTVVTLLDGSTTTAENFIGSYFSTWKYDDAGLCAMALILLIIALRFATFLALLNFRHDKR
eukprot:gene4915-6878_t